MTFRQLLSSAYLLPDSLAYALFLSSEVIAQVINGRNLDMTLSECWQAYDFDARSRGAVQDLSYGALRQYGRGDFFLMHILREPLLGSGIKLRVRALLLAAIYRLDVRPDEAYTTVDQAVEASAMMGAGKFRSLVNAVLRNFLRQRTSLYTSIIENPAAFHQHPSWFVRKIQADYPADWQRILAAGNERPPMTLRVNKRHVDTESYLNRLDASGIRARQIGVDAILLDRPQSVDKLPGFFDGMVSIQDFGAQHAASLLDVQAGHHVLDACAAPGGKTAHLLERADINLLAIDRDPHRITRIEKNLYRLGLSTRIVSGDCCRPDTWWNGQPFDRILADVPCSASGVVRRHPDIKWLRRHKDVATFAHVQRDILSTLWCMLVPGGKMLYCTCSLFPEENELQIAAFVRQHVDAQRIWMDGSSSSGYAWQLIPQPEHDGFFYALLQKRI